MEKVYKLEDSVRGEVEYLSESYIVGGAEFWAERMNEENEEGDSEYIVTDVESAIDIYESASIWVKQIKFEGVSLSSDYVIEFETVEDIAEHINDNLILLADIEENNGNEVRADECDKSRDILQDYMNQYSEFKVEETLENFNNFSELIQYEYEIMEVV